MPGLRGVSGPTAEPAAAEETELVVGPADVRFRVVWPGQAPALYEVLPLLDSLGLRVVDHHVDIAGHGRADEFVLLPVPGLATAGQVPGRRGGLLRDSFRAMRAGRAEADGFDRLVLGVGLPWREVSVLRAAYRYLRQAGVTPNQRLVEQVLLRFPDVCRLLIDLFGFRLDSQLHDEARAEAARAELDAAVDAIESADDDRIVRAFVRFIDATVRTNFFAGDVPLSFKLDQARLPFLPHPRPLVETFVYAPAVEGLHLRAARVARGGVRWSERSEDYRRRCSR